MRAQLGTMEGQGRRLTETEFAEVQYLALSELAARHAANYILLLLRYARAQRRFESTRKSEEA